MFTKRSFRRTVVALVLVSLIGSFSTLFPVTGIKTAQAQTPSCGPTDRVTANKALGRFECRGQKFRFVGVNMRPLIHLADIIFGYEGKNPTQAGQILFDQLKTANDMGVKVIRAYLPREDKASTSVLIAKLKELMDFATATSYSGTYPRPGGPPAPNMKFLVSLTDSIYDSDRSPNQSNSILPGDRSAYAGTGLQFLRGDWYKPTGAVPNYTTQYKTYVTDVVDSFKNDYRIFAWELGNEIFAED